MKKDLRFARDKKNLVIAAALIVILGFAVYANSLKGEFLWDDSLLIRDNVNIKSWSNISEIFRKDIGAGAGLRFSTYRPLQMFVYMIVYSFAKLDVLPYHMVSVLFHVLTALSILWLVYVLFGNTVISFLTAALFAVHPLHTGAVSYMSGLADPLATVFMVLSLIFYIKSVTSKRINSYLISLLCFTIALFSRENSLILPFLLILYHFAFKEKIKAVRILPVACIAVFYILFRTVVLNIVSTHSITDSTLPQRIPGFFVAVANYVRLLFLPLDLHMEYGNKLFGMLDGRVILGVAVVISLLGLAFAKRNTNRLVFFGTSWFFITLLPVANLYPIGTYMAEHWLYLPSIGFFLIMAGCVSNVLKRDGGFKVAALVLAAALLLFYSLLTIKQNNYWRQPLAFYNRTLEYAPKSARTYNNIGRLYNSMGKREEAIRSFEKALKLNPEYAEVYNNLGVLYHFMKRNDEALAMLKKAMELEPDLVSVYNNLGNLERTMKNYGEAISLLEKAVRLNPRYIKAYNNLGYAYHATGRTAEAIEVFEKVLSLDSDEVGAYNNLGSLYCSTGQNEKAITLLEKAISVRPDYVKAYYNLGVAYAAKNETAKAVSLLKKTLSLKSDYAKAANKLAEIYYSAGQHDLAIRYCDLAQRLGLTVSEQLLHNLEPHR